MDRERVDNWWKKDIFLSWWVDGPQDVAIVWANHPEEVFFFGSDVTSSGRGECNLRTTDPTMTSRV